MGLLIIIMLISFFINLIPLHYYQKTNSKWFTLLYFILSVGGFYWIWVLTIPPHVTSGNGNLAILFIPLILFLYAGFLYICWKESTRALQKRSMPFMYELIVVTGVLMVILIYKEVQFIHHLIELLGGGPTVPESQIFRYGWFNQYTNTFYFNIYTFLLGCTSCLLLVGIKITLNRKNE
jgi:hypothetical protein